MGRAGRCGAVCATTFSVDKSGAGNERINLWVYSSPLVAWAATRGTKLTGKAGNTVHLRVFNPNIFPACYPYLNPFGVQGYRYGLRYNDTPANVDPANAPDPNAVFGEDEPDDTALVVDADEREHLPKHREFLSARDW